MKYAIDVKEQNCTINGLRIVTPTLPFIRPIVKQPCLHCMYITTWNGLEESYYFNNKGSLNEVQLNLDPIRITVCTGHGSTYNTNLELNDNWYLH